MEKGVKTHKTVMLSYTDMRKMPRLDQELLSKLDIST